MSVCYQMTVQVITYLIKGLGAAMQGFMLGFLSGKLLWPSIKSLFMCVTAETKRRVTGNTWSVWSDWQAPRRGCAHVKGTLRSFREEILGQHRFILLYFVYMWRTLPPYELHTVFWGPYFPLRTVCSFSYGNIYIDTHTHTKKKK